MSALLQARSLELSFNGRKVLDGLSLDAEPGEVVALIGPSGAGKSTLLRALLGMQRVDRGEVLLDGESVRRVNGRSRARHLGWLPQIGIVAEPIPVIDLIAAARYRFDEGRAASEAAARSALGHCGIERLARQPVNTLSGGEMQRVAIAALVAQDPAMLLLDEPSNHLDVRRQKELYGLLGREWRSGRGLVLISHDVNLLADLGPAEQHDRIRLVAIGDGQVAWERPYDDPDLHRGLSDLFDLELRSIDVDGQRLILPVGTGS